MSNEIDAPITLSPVSISAPVTLGYAGKSAYQSYLDTTDDDPVLTEEEWSAATEGGGATTFAALTDKATADLPAINGPLASALAGKQPLDADLTSWAGVTRATGFDTFTGTPSSANLAALVTDETGSGPLVFGNAPTFAGFSAEGQIEFNGTDAGDSLTFNMVNYFYGTGAAAAHRIALGAGTTGAELFQAATAEAARTTLMGEIIKYDPNAAAPRTNPTFADDDVLAGINLTPGLWEISFYFAHDAGTCGVQARLRFGTPANVDSPGSQNYGFVFRGNQALQALSYVLATGTFTANAATTSITNWHHTGQVTVNVTGNTTLAMQYQYGTSVAGQTITRRAGAFLRARKIA